MPRASARSARCSKTCSMRWRTAASSRRRWPARRLRILARQPCLCRSDRAHGSRRQARKRSVAGRAGQDPQLLDGPRPHCIDRHGGPVRTELRSRRQWLSVSAYSPRQGSASRSSTSSPSASAPKRSAGCRVAFMEMVASGKPLRAVLRTMSPADRSVRSRHARVRYCCWTRTACTLRHGAAPSLPAEIQRGHRRGRDRAGRRLLRHRCLPGEPW